MKTKTKKIVEPLVMPAKTKPVKNPPSKRTKLSGGRYIPIASFVVAGRLTINNHLYATDRRTGRRFMDAKAKQFVTAFSQELDKLDFTLLPNSVFALSITYWCTDGKSYEEAAINEFDVEGSHKAALDCIIQMARAKRLKAATKRWGVNQVDAEYEKMVKREIDDKWCWEATFKKRLMRSKAASNSLNELYPNGYTVIELSLIPESVLTGE